MLGFLFDQLRLEKSVLIRRLTCNCLKILYDRGALSNHTDVKNAGSILGMPLWPCIDVLKFSVWVKKILQNFDHNVMYQMTRPTTCRNAKIVLWDAGQKHSLQQCGQKYCSNRFSTSSLCLLRNWLQTVVVFLGNPNKKPQSFFHWNEWWYSLWKCSFHWDCCFSNDGLLSLVTLWLYFCRIRAGFPPAVRIFITRWNALCFFGNEVLQKRVSERRIDENVCWLVPKIVWTFSVDGIKTSTECHPHKFVVFESKTRPMHTWSFKAHTNSEFGSLRNCVHFLHTIVNFPAFFNDGLVSNYWPLPTSAEENWVLWHFSNGCASAMVVLSSMSRIRSPEASVCQIREVLCRNFGAFKLPWMNNWLHDK